MSRFLSQLVELQKLSLSNAEKPREESSDYPLSSKCQTLQSKLDRLVNALKEVLTPHGFSNSVRSKLLLGLCTVRLKAISCRSPEYLFNVFDIYCFSIKLSECLIYLHIRLFAHSSIHL